MPRAEGPRPAGRARPWTPGPTMEQRRRSAMEEEKRPLPGYKEFLERMYGVEIPEPTPLTPEYREAVVRRMEEYRKHRDEVEVLERDSQPGPKDT